jgi:hypothetical protein
MVPYLSRDGSILHRSLSTNTNATTIKILRHDNTPVVPKYSEESSHHESPKVQNMEEISLMALEKDLAKLEENNNHTVRKKKTFDNNVFEQLSRLFHRRRASKFHN